MMSVKEIREALKDRMPRKVAEVTGLHYNTIRNFRDDLGGTPTEETIKKLSDYLESRKVTRG